jgi:cyclin-dependent kinase regulatory subunit CKS1
VRSHVVLPPDIAKLLPKNRLLSEVRAAPRAGRNTSRAAPPGRSDCSTATRCLTHSRAQAEWRGMGVQQSRGWVHYAIHRPEPHIMLYRCVASRARGARIAAPSL